MHWLDWKMSNFYHTWSEIALSSLCLSLSVYRTDNCMDPWSQTRHCDVSFDPSCQVKGEENRKLTCALTLATVWLLLPVWSGGFRPLQVHVWLPPHHAGSLAATSNVRVCWIQQHELWIATDFCLKKIKSQFLGFCLFVCFLPFISLFLIFFFFWYRERQIISIKSLSLTFVSNLSSVQCSSCSFKFLPASVRI